MLFPRHRTLAALLVVGSLLGCSPLSAQRINRYVEELLAVKLLSPEVLATELQNYALRRLPPLPVISTAEAWTAESRRLREKYLREIVFHGWPEEWVNAPLRVEERGPVSTGGGYRLRKLQFEIVPGFHAAALLYEPATLQGRAPAVLNVNGHDRAGLSAVYKQKRCINQALRGMVALSVEFLGFGEMNDPENAHQSWGPHLDLVGTNAVGLFYLAMRRGLDYLSQHPDVDRGRIAMTGLSGGGWQTIVLSALDERIAVAIPVAGYGSSRSMIDSRRSIGDIEQTPTDMLTVLDYPHLTAMRAPRPTLLIYNAEDDCCFRAPLVKPGIFEDVRPFFRLHSAEHDLAWHQSTDPGYHNYEEDNRKTAYAFLLRHFGLPGDAEEIRVDAELRSPEELRVGLPNDNLTILQLAKKRAAQLERPMAGSGEPDGTQRRSELARVLRHQPVEVAHAFALDNTHAKGIETISYRIQFSDGLSAAVVRLKLTTTPDGAPATLVLHDKGRSAAAGEVVDRIFRGDQVFVVTLLFHGEAELPRPGNASFARLAYTLGARPLGLQAAQLHALTTWIQSIYRPAGTRLEASGLRSQTLSLVSAALRRGRLGEIVIRDGIDSLGHLLDASVRFENAPELFCLDLYQYFDLEHFESLGAPTKVIRR